MYFSGTFYQSLRNFITENKGQKPFTELNTYELC